MAGKRDQRTTDLGDAGEERIEKRRGRPAKADGARVPYEELDKLLVFGEQVPCDEKGEQTTVYYPTLRELSRRFDVAVSLISKYAHQHNCMRRREEAQARIHARVDQKLIEFRATAIARTREDELRTIDGFLAGFESAVAEGRVRVDNPSDYNQMIRLREYLMGGADSRQEVHTSVSLEELQARHRRMLLAAAEETGVERGRLVAPESDAEDGLVYEVVGQIGDADDADGTPAPPPIPPDPTTPEVNTQTPVSTFAPPAEGAVEAPEPAVEPALAAPDCRGWNDLRGVT
jgi:hypothetical protein